MGEGGNRDKGDEAFPFFVRMDEKEMDQKQ